MTRRKIVGDPVTEIVPGAVYRVSLGDLIFGFAPEATKQKIRSGELPLPFPLSPSSRVQAWTGQQILEHRSRMQALAAEKLGAERCAYKDRQPQPQPKAFVEAAVKRRKIKLKPQPKAQKRETAG